MPPARPHSKPSVNPPRRPKAAGRPAQPGAAPAPVPVDDLRADLTSIVADPDRWLNTPNDLFGGRLPVELIGTDDEHLLREWVRAVQHGVMS